MERPAFELGEVLEEDGDKCRDVLRCFQGVALTIASSAVTNRSEELYGGTYHFLAIVCIGEPDANWLVDEENIRVVVPCLLEALSSIFARHSARSYDAIHGKLCT